MLAQEIKSNLYDAKFFFRFLKINNAFSGFVHGITKNCLEGHIPFGIAFEMFVKTLNAYPQELIDDCLYWNKTDEGENFWINIDDKWRRACFSENIEEY